MADSGRATFDVADFAHTQDPEDQLRTDLQDALKDYGPDDLLVEILQNAVDALDELRYQAICSAAGLDGSDHETISKWNAAVEEVLNEDQTAFTHANDESLTQVAALYEKWLKVDDRRAAWWKTLSEHFQCSAKKLERAADADALNPRLKIRYWPSTKILEVEENGIGMNLTDRETALGYLRHKGSTKRTKANRDRRLGERGSHGWGLTSILAQTDKLTVISRRSGKPISGIEMTGWATFTSGGPPMVTESLDQSQIDSRLTEARLPEEESGTLVRLTMSVPDDTSVLG